MAIIQYRSFKFYEPSLISSDEFETLKEVLNERPGFNINPPSSFVATFKVELIIFGFGGIGLLLLSLDLPERLQWLAVIPLFFAFPLLFSFVPSVLTYLAFLVQKALYYRKLKIDILKSSNYEEFIYFRLIK